MRRIPKGKIVLAAAAVLLLAAALVTAFAPMADRGRAQADYITELSAENWVASQVYEDGWMAEDILLNGQAAEGPFLFQPDDTVSFEVPAGLTGQYRIGMVVRGEEEKPADVLLSVSCGDISYTAFAPILWYDEVRGDSRYATDRYGNEIANTQLPYPQAAFQTLLENTDVDMNPISLEPAGKTIEIVNQSQALRVEEIWLYQEKEPLSYEEYLAAWPEEGPGKGTGIIQGEDYSIKSDSYIRSVYVSNLSMTPYDTYRRLINTLDGSSFSDAGQKVMWEFTVEEDGWYEIGLHFSQNSAVNKTVYRQVEVDGAVPFQEMELAAFPQTGNQAYETSFFADENGENYRFYLTAGRHTLALTARMGPIREVYDELQSLVEEMNGLGMDLTRLAAGVSDENRTWDLDSYMPNAVPDIQSYISRLESLYARLEELEGEKPAYADSLNYAVQVLEQLLEKPRQIPNKVNLLNSGDNSAVKYINNAINNMTALDLGIDEIYVKAAEADFQEKSVSPLVRLATSVRKLLYSLDPEAVQSTNGTAGSDESLTVWMSRSSIYVQVLQGMVDAAPELADMDIDISIMPSEQKLVLAAAAGNNPDVALGVGVGTPYKFAIRGAALDLTQFEDFLPFYASQYTVEGLVPCVYDGGIYGAVETKDYSVLFYRSDILDTLGIDVPSTWNEVKAVMPSLLRYNKNISLPIANVIGFRSFALTTPYLYQHGGELYEADGAQTAFMESGTVDGMQELTELFKVYAVEDYVASFYNSFRNGDTPLGVGGVSMYVQLSEAAPELAGKWDIAPAPGLLLEDGTVVQDMSADSTMAMIFQNTDKKEEAWRFLKWWLSAETQSEFARTLELAYGTEYRWNTANLAAFAESSYPEDHKEVILSMWEGQRETLQHPASYIVERELSNAYTNVVVNGDSVVEALWKSSLVSDREIMRKLKEFGFCDEDGNLIRDYPIQAMEMIETKLREQSGGEK